MDIYQPLKNPIALIIFIITLFLPVLVGLITQRQNKNQTDFLLAGRKLNKFVVALSAVSSGRSSWLVLGFSGLAYQMGVRAVWAVVGYILVELFQFIYIGRKLRDESGALESLTLLDYFESKFKDNTHLIRWTGIIIICIFLTAYVAAQLNAGAKSLSIALNTPFILSLIISVSLIVIYMVLGGFIAVAYNDVIRAVIMIIGLVLFPIFGLIRLVSFQELFQLLKNLDIQAVDPFALSIGAFAGFLGIGLGSPGQPHIVVRYMSIKESDHLRWSALIGTIWNVLLAWGALFIGLIGKAVVPAVSLPDGNTEMIYLKLASDFFGPVFYGLLIGGIFAAILSTADSQLMVLSSTIVRDLYEKIIGHNRHIEEKDKIKLSRIVIILAGCFAMILAYLAKDLIFWLVLFAWGGLGASFGSTLILSLYWKKATRAGIVSGMISGTIITIVWKLFLKTPTGIYELIPAFFGALGITIIVSLISRTKS